MAVIYSLTGDAAAREHLEAYLRLAPDAPDADAVRRALSE